MKSKLLIILVFVLASCRNENDRNSVQGTYVAQFQTEYSKGMDTVEIIPINEDAGTFRYVRRIGYKRISGGVPGPDQYKVENSTCVFNKSTSQLNEERFGRIYSFPKDGNQLISGKSVYKRIP
jgi:hypothetical protein